MLRCLSSSTAISISQSFRCIICDCIPPFFCQRKAGFSPFYFPLSFFLSFFPFLLGPFLSLLSYLPLQFLLLLFRLFFCYPTPIAFLFAPMRLHRKREGKNEKQRLLLNQLDGSFFLPLCFALFLSIPVLQVSFSHVFFFSSKAHFAGEVLNLQPTRN